MSSITAGSLSFAAFNIREPPVAPGEELFVHEQAEAVLEAEVCVVGLLALFDDP